MTFTHYYCGNETAEDMRFYLLLCRIVEPLFGNYVSVIMETGEVIDVDLAKLKVIPGKKWRRISLWDDMKTCLAGLF